MLKSSEILKLAAQRVASGWCQHAAARNKKGHSVPPTAKTAGSWCAGGSITASAPKDQGPLAMFTAKAWLAETIKPGYREGHRRWITADIIAPFNDAPHRKQGDVVHALLSAAAAAEAAGD